MMRKKIIAGNWKMNKTPAEAADFARAMRGAIDTERADVVLVPPFVSLAAVVEALAGSGIAVGAQNMYFEDNGAFTGAIAADMLSALGVRYVIVGHSERRAYFSETDENVNKKVTKALEKGLVPIMCVGESLSQREQGVTMEYVRLQVKVGLYGIPARDVSRIVVAYEPIWAIGTGVTAANAQAEAVCAAIRAVVAEITDSAAANAIRVQYGGSVTAANASALLAMPNIDGALVGGASLTPEFADIVRACR